MTGSRTVCRNLSVRGGFATVAKATKVARAGCTVDPVTKALTPSIVMSSTFEREKDLSYDGEFIYGRMGNPTRSLLEKTLAELEGGDEACSFGQVVHLQLLLPQDIHLFS